MGISSWYLEVSLASETQSVDFSICHSHQSQPQHPFLQVMQLKFQDQKLRGHLQLKVQCTGNVHFTMYPTPLFWILLSSDTGEECISAAIIHNPWMKYWRRPIAFLPCCFESSTNKLSFRKFCICAFLCLLPQIQRLNVLTLACFCAHRQIPMFFYTGTITVWRWTHLIPIQWRNIFHVRVLFVQASFGWSAVIHTSRHR